MTSSEENIATMRRFVEEVQQNGKVELFDEFVADDFIDHTAPPGTTDSREGARNIMRLLQSTLSDIHIKIHHIACDGKSVITHKTIHGVQKGEFMGNPPTGKRMKLRVMDVVTMEKGIFKAHWATMAPMEVDDGK